MTSLSTSPLMVSLVQTAGTLPMFLLALPAGALADIVDRRKVLLATQIWMLLIALCLGILTYLGTTGPILLLTFTFLLSLGAAISMPAWQAITPELVSGPDLPPALTLNSVGINISRAIGPALGGFLISSFGTHIAFLFNAFSFLFVLVIVSRWDRPKKETTLPAERFFSAMRLGVRYAKHSPELRAVIYRTAAFIIPASAIWALLPLATRKVYKGDSSEYGILLTCIGLGAVFGAALIPRLKAKLSIDGLVAGGIFLLAIVFVILGTVTVFYFICASMLFAGMAWLTLLSSLNVSAQTAVPSWVRARTMAIYFMLVFFGGIAGGSILWGALAHQVGIQRVFFIAAAGLILGWLITRSYRLSGRECLNLAPSLHWPAPTVEFEPNHDDGPVLITVEYQIDPEKTSEFVNAMEQIRLARLRDGALHWGLFQDTENSKRFVENFIVESWAEHLRQHDRVTVQDKQAQEKARKFHIGDFPPKVSHLLYSGKN